MAGPFLRSDGLAWRGEAHLTAASQGMLYILPAPCTHVVRLVVASGESEEVDLPRGARATRAMFADPHAGLSLLLATRDGENVYVHRSRSRVLGKLKGVVITAMGWLRPEGGRADGPREVVIG